MVEIIYLTLCLKKDRLGLIEKKTMLIVLDVELNLRMYSCLFGTQ